MSATSPISAWDMGPVVGELWYREKSNAAPVPASPLNEAVLNTVGYVVSRYGALSGSDLERLTHSEQPWRDANATRKPSTSAKISIAAIREYFASARDDEGDEATSLPDVEAVANWLGAVEPMASRDLRPDSLEELRARLIRA
jgi:uncharacterized phage-associated protein